MSEISDDGELTPAFLDGMPNASAGLAPASGADLLALRRAIASTAKAALATFARETAG